MAAYAVVAVLLAVAGTYAVLSYLVAQRRRELAVRVALGAAPGAIVGLVARESLVLVGLGVALGVVGAAGLARLLSGLLYGVGAMDLRVALGVAGATAFAGVAAALLPARRAAMVDPADVLRGG